MARSVEGLARLKAKLAAMTPKSKENIKKALNESADELLAFQRRLVPVDEGDLRDSLEKVDGEHELQVIVRAGGRRAHHARWVEFGTKKMSARPYFFPAYRALRRKIRSKVTRAVNKAAREAAGSSS